MMLMSNVLKGEYLLSERTDITFRKYLVPRNKLIIDIKVLIIFMGLNYPINIEDCKIMYRRIENLGNKSEFYILRYYHIIIIYNM